jgi:hypothetical protein
MHMTEYSNNFLKFDVEGRVRGMPQVQQLTVGGEFSGSTER